MPTSVKDSKLSSANSFRIHLVLAHLPPPLSALEPLYLFHSLTLDLRFSTELCVSPRAIIRWVKCIYTGKSGRSVQQLIDGEKA